MFTYKILVPDIAFTRSGVLSLVNSIYEPFGLAAQVLLESRLLLQELVCMGKESTASTSLGWHDQLPDKLTDNAHFVLSLATSWHSTSMSKGDGGKFSTWPTNFGPDGVYPHSASENGVEPAASEPSGGRNRYDEGLSSQPK